MYRGIIKADIVPVLGKTKVAAVEYADIDRLHASLSKRAPYLANCALGTLSKMFALGILW